MELLIGLILGAFGGFVVGLLIYRPKKRQSLFNLEQEQTQQLELKKQREELQGEIKQLSQDIQDKKVRAAELSAIIAGQYEKRDALFQNIADIEKQAEQTTKAIYEKSYLQMSNKMDQSAEKLSKEFRTAQKECEDEYLTLLADLASSVQTEIVEKKEELTQVLAQLADL